MVGIISENDVLKAYLDISEEINQKVIDYENEYMNRTGDVPPEFYGEKYRMQLMQEYMNQNKANGGRIGRRFGGDTMKKKTNIQKIRETFAPKKKLSPKQMKIAKQAGDPNRIDGADFKKLRSK